MDYIERLSTGASIKSPLVLSIAGVTIRRYNGHARSSRDSVVWLVNSAGERCADIVGFTGSVWAAPTKREKTRLPLI